MKRTATIAAVVLAIALGGFSIELTRPTSVVAKASLPDPGLTGAPPGGGSCYSCHNGGLNNLSGIILIYPPSSYVPGQDYYILTAVTGNGSRWGFELTALTAGNTMAGAFSDTSNAVAEQTSGGITYVSQTTNEGFDGTYADSLGAAWLFKWTAPASGAGPVTFYAAGVACDNDNTANSGDFTFTTSATSTEATTDVEKTTWGKIKTIYR
jgi:hypothetical protein